MDYKERFRNTLKRLKSGSNIARYNTICTLTQNDDEQRVWAICREFWGNNEAPLNIENYDVKDLDAAYQHIKNSFNHFKSNLQKSAITHHSIPSINTPIKQSSTSHHLHPEERIWAGRTPRRKPRVPDAPRSGTLSHMKIYVHKKK